MKMAIMAVKDEKAGMFENPFCAPNRATAIRSFGQACKDQSTPMAKFPDDFALYAIGEYNNETGEIKGEKPTSIISAKDYQNQNKEEKK